jgi:GntR family transcriptional regulator
MSPMDTRWDPALPIYRQLRDRLVAMILDGALNDGDALPSVRRMAADCRLNPLTVLRSYQRLAAERLVERRRGRGLYVCAGASVALRSAERRRFLDSEWPRVRAAIIRLGLSPEDLLQGQPTVGATPAAKR